MTLRHFEACIKPIFIIGSPRSGTSILSWALAQHSQLATSQESDVLYNLLANGQVLRAVQMDAARAERQPDVTPEEFLRWLGLGVNALWTVRSRGKRWVDSTPINTLIADSLVTMFEDAMFLHIIRDGRRVVNSMISFSKPVDDPKRMSLLLAGQLPGWSEDFGIACRTWRDFVDLAGRFCRKWPDRTLEIHNEDLVTDPVNQFHRMSDFLEIPFEPRTSRYFATNRINSSHRSESHDPAWVRQLDEPWRSWSDEQLRTFDEVAGETMLRLGLATVDGLPVGR